MKKVKKYRIYYSLLFLFFFIKTYISSTRYNISQNICSRSLVQNFAKNVAYLFSSSIWVGPQSGVISPTSTSSQQHATQLRMPPPTQGGINEPQECPYCRRTFSCYYSLKRHFQDKHEQSDTLYVCEFCHRRYRTKNSLTTHKSLQHRGSSGMLKRLLKTSAIKNVLGSHVSQHPRQHLFDFAAELGQPPPPGIPQ